MKVRNGFVSNSSTSSFVIRVSQGTTEEQMRDMVEKHIGILDTCFLENFKEDMIDTILKCKGSKIDTKERLEEEKNNLKDREWGKQEWVDEWQDIVDKNLDVYQGGFDSDGSNPVEILLNHLNFKINKDDLFMENYNGC